MEDLKAYYDVDKDILYLARQGQEEEFFELAPGVNVELDQDKNLLGIEIFQASKVLRDVLDSLKNRATVT